jgi:hypothetical protein
MRQLIFALQFTGSATPGGNGALHAKTTASSQALRTVLSAAGLQSSVEPVVGGAAAFESEVAMSAEGTFDEWGTITYGTAGTIRFKTVGRGIIAPSPVEGLQRGAVVWEVTGGDGRFSGATGLITSNFSVNEDGEVIDNQFAQLFVS